MLEVADSQRTFRNDGKLFLAVANGYLSEVKKELSHGDIDLQLTFNGKSFLETAGSRGHKEIARQLILHGANANEVRGNRKNSLLHTAAITGNYGFASVLLETAEPSPQNVHGATPLHYAARNGGGYMVNLLLSHRANIDATDTNGRTPLFIALSKGETSIVKTLLRSNSNPDIQTRRGTTARQVAEELGLNLKDFSMPAAS
jgi:ankyrin repeat protein